MISQSDCQILDSQRIMDISPSPSQLAKGIAKQQQSQQLEFKQSPYRWVIIALAASCMILNGLLNNIIIPIASKLSALYGYSTKVVNMGTIMSFLIFSLINIPINYLLDKKGIQIGFRIGLGIYLAGITLACMVNAAFPLVIVGYIIFTFGQPFILNTPAKIATYWFFPQNRAIATSILVGCGIIGSGLGFALPTVAISEDAEGEIGQRQVFSLYMGYALATLIMLIINYGFFRAKPKIPTSNVVQKEELSLKQTFAHIKKDKNIWKFYICYFLVYGSFQTFATSANLLIKPFGASDIDISIAAVCLILLGTLGAVLGSIIIKKYRCYKLVLRVCCVGALACIVFFAIQLLTVNSIRLIQANVALLGFFLTPIIPVSYQIGCEIAFPIGQAQVTGLLNGSSLIWAFISDSLLTLIVGFGTKTKTMIFVLILIIFIGVGNILCFLVKVDLKRKRFEQSLSEASTRNSDANSQMNQVIQMAGDSEVSKKAKQINKKQNYQNLKQENL